MSTTTKMMAATAAAAPGMFLSIFFFLNYTNIYLLKLTACTTVTVAPKNSDGHRYALHQPFFKVHYPFLVSAAGFWLRPPVFSIHHHSLPIFSFHHPFLVLTAFFSIH
jgi:hypothetical protein